MRAVTDETFDAEVLQAGLPVVVDFWAPWCGPCKAIEPALRSWPPPPKTVEFVKIDIDENPGIANRYGVLSIPTVILFEGGEVRHTVLGARPKKHFARTFAEYL